MLIMTTLSIHAFLCIFVLVIVLVHISISEMRETLILQSDWCFDQELNMGGFRVGTRGPDSHPLENHKWLYVYLEILVRIPSRTKNGPS